MKVWIPALAMTLVSLISYIDRNTLALLAPTILKETGLSGEQYGWVISSFSVAYMIGNPIWGRTIDRIGLRTGMLIAVAFWTTASVSHAFAIGFWSFAVSRAILGFGEGATFPGGLRTVMQTLPAEFRSRGIAVAYSGGSLGAVLTPIIVTPVALYWGWRGAFWFTGLIGAAWVTWWFFLSKRKEISEVRASKIDTQSSLHPSITDRRLWAFMFVYALGSVPLAFILYNASLYLGKMMALDQSTIGKLLWIPPLGWESGYFFWGWQVDRLGLRTHGNHPAFAPLFLALMLLSLPLAVGSQLHSVPLLMFLMFFSMFIAAGFIMLSVAYATSSFSSAHAGYLAGIGAGSWSAIVALIMPWFGRLFDQSAYSTAFLAASIFPFIGWLGWKLLHHPGHQES